MRCMPQSQNRLDVRNLVRARGSLRKRKDGLASLLQRSLLSVTRYNSARSRSRKVEIKRDNRLS